MDKTGILLITLLKLLPNLWLIILPFRRRLRVSFAAANLIAVIFSISTVLCVFFLISEQNPFKEWHWYFSTIYLLICAVLYISAIRGAFFQKIFTLFVIQSYADDVFLLSKSLEIYWFPTAIQKVTLASSIPPLICVLIFSLPLMWLFMTRLLRPMIETNDDMTFWRYLWIVPSSFYIIFHLSVYPGYGSQFFAIDSHIFVLQLVWIIGTFLTYYVILRMLSETAQNGKLREKLHISDIQLLMQKEQYKSLKKNIEETRRARHDLRHHLLAMKGLAQNHDTEGIGNYLESCLMALTPEDAAPVCENYAADAVVRYYIGRARNNHVTVFLRLNIPSVLPMPESDLCIILGNLLENAVEACIRQKYPPKFIDVKVDCTEQYTIVLSIRNSFDHEIHCHDGQFLSSKRNGEGIGIASVRNMIEQYDGISKFNYEDRIFLAQVLLNAKRLQHHL